MNSYFRSNPFLKFISSVRLAVPLMLLLIVIVAWGTIVESRYSADIAKLRVYNTLWFQALMALLWINILMAALSRWPFRKAHTGFVITHIGLLTLLIGGMLTGYVGIDGQLMVQEGTRSNQVYLPDLVLGVASEQSLGYSYYPIERKLSAADSSDFSGLNSEIKHILSIEKFLPFVAGPTQAAPPTPTGPSVAFHIKSAFFDVNEWVGEVRPSLSMGPVTFRYFTEEPKKPTRKAAVASKDDPELVIKSKNKDTLKTIKVSDLAKKSITVNDVTVQLVRKFRNATVVQNAIDEGDPASSNPALELKVTKAGSSLRDITYAKHKGFSLNPEGAFGLFFEYNAADDSGVADPHQGHAPGSAAQEVGQGNEVHFVPQGETYSVKLLKAGKTIAAKVLKKGEEFETPWMGMKLTIRENFTDSGAVAAVSQELREVELIPRSGVVPPAALKLSPAFESPGASFWIVEGEEKPFVSQGRAYRVYFGKRMITLPFEVQLEKFYKVDYPGTNTAKSFESDIVVPNDGTKAKISMNEPLYKEGYTLYQASYQMMPGQPAISIFSVNRDPGRWVKYLGSLILSLGIIIFTLQRSRWAKRIGF